MESAFKALKESTDIELESSVLTELYACLVKEGNFERVEEILDQVGKDGLFNDYIKECVYKPIWRRIKPGKISYH